MACFMSSRHASLSSAVLLELPAVHAGVGGAVLNRFACTDRACVTIFRIVVLSVPARRLVSSR
jgi:hypothetical protein